MIFVLKDKENTVENICTCETNVDSELITCADKSCVVKQYHITCLGIEKVTKKKWFCPYCSRKANNQENLNENFDEFKICDSSQYISTYDFLHF